MTASADGRRRLNDVHALLPLTTDHQKNEFEYQLNELMACPTAPYDSQPVQQDRIALQQKLNIDVSAERSLDLVWDLFADEGALKAEMTGFIQTNVDEYQAMAEAQERAMGEGLGEYGQKDSRQPR